MEGGRVILIQVIRYSNVASIKSTALFQTLCCSHPQNKGVTSRCSLETLINPAFLWPGAKVLMHTLYVEKCTQLILRVSAGGGGEVCRSSLIFNVNQSELDLLRVSTSKCLASHFVPQIRLTPRP